MSKAVGVSFAVSASLGATVASAFSTASSRIKSLSKDVKDLKKEQAAASNLAEAHGKLEKLRAAYATAPSKQLKAEVDMAARAFTRAEKGAGKYNISVAEAAKVQARATMALKTTSAELERQQKLQANTAKRQELHGQILGTVASFSAVAAPVKLAIDYESAMADVKKVTSFDAPGWAQFNDDLLKLSTTIPMSAEGLAKISAAAGQAGIAKEELLRFTEDAAKMAVAFDISAEQAGSAMTGLRTNFALNQDGVIKLGDAFNHLANNIDVKASELVDFSNRLGGTASIYKFTGQQVGALGAAFVAMKTPAEVGARAANSLMMKLGNAGTLGKDAQAAFQRLGFSGKEMSEAFKKDAQGSMLTFLEAVKRSKDPMRDLNAIMGEGFADEIAKLVNGVDHYKKALRLAGDEAAYAGSMQEEYNQRSKTTANAITLMKNAAARMGIVLGTTVLPGIAAVANISVKLLDPVSKLAANFPVVTKVVFGAAAALVSLKVAALAGAYAGTILSDGWLIARGIFNAVRPSVLANTAALQKQRVVTLYTAAATRVKVVWEKAHALAVAMSNRQTALATLAQVRHRVVTLAVAAGTKVMAVAQWALNVAMTANPIGVVVVGLTALAGWFYTAYEKAGSFTGALRVMWDQFKAVVPTMEVVEAAVVGMVTFVSDLWNGASLYDAGAKLMGTLWNGVVAMWQTVKGYWNKIKGMFGFGEGDDLDIKAVSESKTVGEHSTVTRTETVGQVEAKAQPVNTAGATPGTAQTPPVQSVSHERGQAPAPSGSGAQAQARSGGSGGGAIQITQQFSFQFNGMPDKEFANRVVEAVKSKTGDLEKVLGDIIVRQRRLAYDS